MRKVLRTRKTRSVCWEKKEKNDSHTGILLHRNDTIAFLFCFVQSIGFFLQATSPPPTRHASTAKDFVPRDNWRHNWSACRVWRPRIIQIYYLHQMAQKIHMIQNWTRWPCMHAWHENLLLLLHLLGRLAFQVVLNFSLNLPVMWSQSLAGIKHQTLSPAI